MISNRPGISISDRKHTRPLLPSVYTTAPPPRTFVLAAPPILSPTVASVVQRLCIRIYQLPPPHIFYVIVPRVHRTRQLHARINSVFCGGGLPRTVKSSASNLPRRRTDPARRVCGAAVSPSDPPHAQPAPWRRRDINDTERKNKKGGPRTAHVGDKSQ